MATKKKQKKFKVYYFTGDYFSSHGETRGCEIIKADNEQDAERWFKSCFPERSFGWVEPYKEHPNKTKENCDLNFDKNPLSIRRLIADRMRILDDFGICDRHDHTMKKMLENAIAEKPDKDPEVVLEMFCRPMIQAKVNSWK